MEVMTFDLIFNFWPLLALINGDIVSVSALVNPFYYQFYCSYWERNVCLNIKICKRLLQTFLMEKNVYLDEK